jgi:hypothetical protein
LEVSRTCRAPNAEPHHDEERPAGAFGPVDETEGFRDDDLGTLTLELLGRTAVA